MDTFHKNILTQRLAHSTQHSALSTQHFDRPTSISRDAIDPANATPADPYPDDENPSEKTQHSAPVRAAHKLSSVLACTQHLKIISPRPLPPEVIEANLRYAEKVRTGKIIIDRSGPWIRAVELPDTDNASEKQSPSEDDQPPSP
jgi:hypothetical protein